MRNGENETKGKIIRGGKENYNKGEEKKTKEFIRKIRRKE
jgi:hypothetical protein